MFKDIYKSANESIDTDEAFERISKKIYGQKPVKKYKIYYEIAAAAACAAIVCAVAFNIPFKDTNIDIRVAKNPPVNETVKQPSASEPPAAPVQNTDAVPPAEKKTTENNSVRFEPKTSEEQTHKEKYTVESNTEEQQEKPAENPEPKHEPIPVRIVMKINKVVAEQALMSASTYKAVADFSESADSGAEGSSSEAAIPKAAAPEPVLRSSGGGAKQKSEEPEELSYDEYCEYIGCDIKVKIPDFTDTSAEFSGIYKNPDGSIAYDAYTFSFEKNDEYLYVTPTKNLSAVTSYLDSPEYEKSLFGETEAVITQCDDVYDAYFIKEDTAYTLMLGNSSEEELKNVILGLTR